MTQVIDVQNFTKYTDPDVQNQETTPSSSKNPQFICETVINRKKKKNRKTEESKYGRNGSR